MERIEFSYVFRDGTDREKVISTSKRDEDGLHDRDICEIFLDFMRSAGFSEENVLKYFKT